MCVGRADRRFNHYDEDTESTLQLANRLGKHSTSLSGGRGGASGETSGSRREPSFVSKIANQTASVGREVTLACQVKDLAHSDYKVLLSYLSDLKFKLSQDISNPNVFDLTDYHFEIE